MQGYHHSMPMAEYLGDPCPAPSLSTRIIETLYKSTPQRAFRKHPKLYPAAFDPSPRADIGSAIHSLIHGGYPLRYVESVALRSGKEKGVSFVPTDWKTEDARDAAKAIRAAGGIPLLLKDKVGIEAGAAAARMVLESIQPSSGKHEVTLTWQHDGVWMRGRSDWLSDGAVIVQDEQCPEGLDLDTKSVEVADAYDWINRSLFQGGYDIQAATRHLGHLVITGKPRQMGWLLQEYEWPYDNAIVLATPEIIEIGLRKVSYAAALWRDCLASNAWPGNHRRVLRASPPAWAAWELENRGVP